MITHSNIPAWEIPWTQEPGRLQSMRSEKIGHDLVTKQQKQYDYIAMLFPTLTTSFMKVKVAQLCPTLCDPMDQSMDFSRPEYWSGQPFPSPGDLPNPGIEPRSPTLQADSLPAEPQGKPLDNYKSLLTGVLSPPFIIFSIFRRQCDLLKIEIRCHSPI